jgi:hypothetical protein
MEREKAAHFAAESIGLTPGPELLNRCRRDLRARIEREQGRRRWFNLNLGRLAAFSRPLGALALIALGFFAARFTAPGPPAPTEIVRMDEPVLSRIRYVQPEPSGQVQVVVDETRQRIVLGRPDDQRIRSLLLTAARDPVDPGLRVESLDILKNRCDSAEVRMALISALKHDPNSGVRLKALDGLKRFAGEPEVRSALSQVLLTDDNPGVRIQAIDLLVQNKRHEDDMISVLQQLVQKEDNNYIRLRCQRVLRDMNASVGTF